MIIFRPIFHLSSHPYSLLSSFLSSRPFGGVHFNCLHGYAYYRVLLCERCFYS